jgi:hypothetical protein
MMGSQRDGQSPDIQSNQTCTSTRMIMIIRFRDSLGGVAGPTGNNYTHLCLLPVQVPGIYRRTVGLTGAVVLNYAKY